MTLPSIEMAGRLTWSLSDIWPRKPLSYKETSLGFSFSPGVLLSAWPRKPALPCALALWTVWSWALTTPSSRIWNTFNGWATLLLSSLFYLLFSHLLFMGCFNLISISGKKKNWILSIIFVVAFLFLADRAWSFNRGSGEGYSTFRVYERPYLPLKWRFPDTPALFSYALLSLMRN